MPPSSKAAITGKDGAHGNRCDDVLSFFGICLPSGATSDADPYEMIRSRELNAMLGPKGSPKAVDLVCDLHNTTANMGLCLIAYSDCDWICLHIFKHLQARNQINSLCPI